MYKYGSSVDKLKEGIFSTLYKIGEEKYKDFEHFSKNYMASVTNCYRSSANFIAVSVLRKMLESLVDSLSYDKLYTLNSVATLRLIIHNMVYNLDLIKGIDDGKGKLTSKEMLANKKHYNSYEVFQSTLNDELSRIKSKKHLYLTHIHETNLVVVKNSYFIDSIKSEFGLIKIRYNDVVYANPSLAKSDYTFREGNNYFVYALRNHDNIDIAMKCYNSMLVEMTGKQ